MPLLKNHVIVSWPLPNVAMSYLIVCWFGRELRASKTCQHKSSTARETQNLKLNQKKSQSPIVETENSLSLSLSPESRTHDFTVLRSVAERRQHRLPWLWASLTLFPQFPSFHFPSFNFIIYIVHVSFLRV